MPLGVEVDFVVTDCLKALMLYEAVFDVERIEVTALETGRNEAVFSILGTRFHMLDENPACGLVAPKPDVPQSIWFNVTVPDIKSTWQKAMQAGCHEIIPLTDMPDLGMMNAMFSDPFGYVWMLHQIFREVGFEERQRIMAEKMKCDKTP